MISELILLVLGGFLVFVIDILWWNIDFKKAEKGMEAHEHYHLGLELLIAGLIVSMFNDLPSYFLVGAGFAFIMAEWRQTVEIKKTVNGEIVKQKVIPGHPFAYGSNHFKQSTAIGIGLTVLLSIILVLRYV